MCRPGPAMPDTTPRTRKYAVTVFTNGDRDHIGLSIMDLNIPVAAYNNEALDV